MVKRLTKEKAWKYLTDYFPLVKERKELLEEIVGKLKAEAHPSFEKNLLIFNLAYGLSDEEPLFWREIGARVGLSHNAARVRFNNFVTSLRRVYAERSKEGLVS